MLIQSPLLIGALVQSLIFGSQASAQSRNQFIGLQSIPQVFDPLVYRPQGQQQQNFRPPPIAVPIPLHGEVLTTQPTPPSDDHEICTYVKEHTCQEKAVKIKCPNKCQKEACELPWVFLEGVGCLLFGDGQRTWFSAKEACIDKGSDLVILTSLSELPVVATYINETYGEYPAHSFWVGGTKVYDQWKWQDDQPINDGWYGTQLEEDNPDERCVDLYDGELWKDNCEDLYRYICEQWTNGRISFGF